MFHDVPPCELAKVGCAKAFCSYDTKRGSAEAYRITFGRKPSLYTMPRTTAFGDRDTLYNMGRFWKWIDR